MSTRGISNNEVNRLMAILRKNVKKDKKLSQNYRKFINGIKPIIKELRGKLNAKDKKNIKTMLDEFGKKVEKNVVNRHKSYSKTRKVSRKKSSRNITRKRGGSHNKNLNEPWEKARKALYTQLHNKNSQLASVVTSMIDSPTKAYGGITLLIFILYYFFATNENNNVLDITSTAFLTAAPGINTYTTIGGFLLIVLILKSVGGNLLNILGFIGDFASSVADRTDYNITKARNTFNETTKDRNVSLLYGLRIALEKYNIDTQENEVNSDNNENFVPQITYHHNPNERRFAIIDRERTRRQRRFLNNYDSNNIGIGNNYEEPPPISNNNSDTNNSYRGKAIRKHKRSRNRNRSKSKNRH